MRDRRRWRFDDIRVALAHQKSTKTSKKFAWLFATTVFAVYEQLQWLQMIKKLFIKFYKKKFNMKKSVGPNRAQKSKLRSTKETFALIGTSQWINGQSNVLKNVITCDET